MRPTAEFYGPGFGTANIELLARFYDEYPDYADKTFISVKVYLTDVKDVNITER